MAATGGEYANKSRVDLINIGNIMFDFPGSRAGLVLIKIDYRFFFVLENYGFTAEEIDFRLWLSIQQLGSGLLVVRNVVFYNNSSCNNC